MKSLKRCNKYTKMQFVRMVMTAIIFSMVSLVMPRSEVAASQASLTWTPPTTYADGSPATKLAGYKIYTGTAPGNYSQSIDVGNVTGYTLSSLNDATSYYFAVTAYDATGVVSGFSNQVAYTTPAPPPSTALYSLTTSAGSGGSISPSGTVAISQGLSQTFTITPASGYKIAGVTVDGISIGTLSSYTFSNVSANHTIAASFTASTSTPGTITSSGIWQNQSFSAQNSTFTAAFDLIPNVNNADAVTVLSAAPAQAYADGAAIVRFNPTGTIDARNGSSYLAGVTIPYTAGNKYHIRMTVNVAAKTYDVYVTPPTGSEIHLATGYKFRTEQAGAATLTNLSVFAGSGSHQVLNFSVTPQLKYAISATAGTGGNISPAGTTSVNSAGSQTYAIIPATGYKIASVTVDGVSVGAVSNYTFSNVTAGHTIAASFAVSSYSIAASSGPGGSISPSGTTVVNNAGSKTYTITPGTGYKIASVIVDGVSVGAVSSYSFSNVTTNHTITASFATTATTVSYSINAIAYANGSVSPSGTSTVSSGGSRTYIITPAAGYMISVLKIDGVKVAAASSYTFSNTKANHTLAVSFKLK